MKIEKLLFVVHFDELRFDVLKSLLDMRKASLNHVVLLNVIERKKVAMRKDIGYQKKTKIKLREKSNIRFIDWAETLFEEGIEVGVHIVVGDFAEQVIKAAIKEDVDLIVIGPEKKGHIEKLCSGSDITEIIKRSRKPVLVHKYQTDDGFFFKKAFSRPLLATSWSSSTSKKAIEFIKNLKKIIEQVDVVHVAKEKDLQGSSAMSIQRTRKQNRQKLELICEELEITGITSRSHVYIGNVTFEIEKAAKKCESTMIVVGYPKKNVWGERWVGSVGKEIVERSIFPTMLIPPGDS